MYFSKVQLYISTGIIAVLLVVMGGQAIAIKIKNNKIEDLTAELNQKETMLIMKETEHTACKNEVDIQNKAIAAWKKKGKDYEITLKEKQVKINELEKAGLISVDEINNQEIPAGCEGAVNWLIERGKGYIK